MTNHRHYHLFLIPGILWLSAGMRLLFKASQLVLINFPFKLFVFLAMIAWLTASLKYRYLLLKSVDAQNHLTQQLLSGSISKTLYLKKTFLSKRFFILIIMASLSILIKKFIPNTAVLFFIRSTIGYALIKTALTYFAKTYQTLSLQNS